MAVQTTNNKPINPRGNDQSPKGYNRAALYSGKALDFDGVNDYVDLDGFTLSGTTATISFYYKTDSNKALAYIFDNTQRWVIGQADTTDSFGFYDGSTWRKSTQTLTLGEWYHITAVIDGGDVELLWNGESIGDTFTGANSISWASLTTFKLGWSHSASGIGQVNGQIAGFKIFNTALTAAQVADLYNNPEKIVPTGVADSALKLYLPMMEGAGTTAYDGSGNGNHGTISGATWTHGVGSPVAQTAVIDWNKGTNLLAYSEQFDNAIWIKNGGTTVTANDTQSPAGHQNADLFNMTSNDTIAQNVSVSGEHTFSIWLKGTAGETIGIGCVTTGGVFVEENKTLTADWQRYSVTATFSSSGTRQVYLSTYGGLTARTLWGWGAQLTATSDVQTYVETLGTAQTSDVLLPQGLTSGRDITGVNLFENVRKQAALNLDGNSWAEVHDNASLDVTDAITLEAWYYHTGSGTKIIQGRWSTQVDNSYLMYVEGNKIKFVGNDGSSTFGGNNSTTDLNLDQFNHVVMTYDRTNLKYYLNGILIDTFAYTVSLNPNASVVLDIGRNDGTSGVYNGSNYNNTPIAQPRIYNRALTAEEVARNYSAGKNTYKN